MAKKPQKRRKGAPKLPSWWPVGFVPCVARDPASVAGGPFAKVFMLAPTFKGTLAVQRSVNMPGHIGIRDRVIANASMKHYTLITDEESALQSELEELKRSMLTEGATPEAVRLVGEHIPISEEEYKIMAEKLKKTAAKKAPAKTKAPAKKASTKSKADAAEAKSDDRKIKVVKKDHGAREGTKRADMLDTIYKAKTVQEAVDAGVKKSDVSWAAREGYIEVK